MAISKTAESSTWKFYLSSDGITNYPPYPSTLISPSSGHVFSSSTSSVEPAGRIYPENLSLLMTFLLTQLMVCKPESSKMSIINTDKSVSVNASKRIIGESRLQIQMEIFIFLYILL